jgi:sodium transport system ATP-binding protein
MSINETSESNGTVIDVRGLSHSFKNHRALAGVSFQVKRQELHGFVGPNGAGKTTALRALTGLVKPDSGSALVDGANVQHDPLITRARLGVLPEVVGLYDHLTVREHLVYSGELHDMGRPDVVSRVEQLLEQLGLMPLADRRAGHLSLGQCRRVALARALVHNPPNVVLDEPTNGLDVLSAREVRREVRRLADAGRAVVLSSHVMPEVSAVCDRIVILSRGLVAASGTPAEILATSGAGVLEEAFVSLIGSEEGLN